MLIHAANNGVFQLQAAVEETLLSMRRAGKSLFYINFFTIDNLVKHSKISLLTASNKFFPVG